MPDKTGRLNRQERTFVEVYAGTNDATYAAARAGYSSPQPRGSQNLCKPAIMAEIRKVQQARLHNELVPLALDHFTDVLKNPDASFRERTMVSKVVLEHWKTVVDDGLQKDPCDMDANELERARQQLLAELAARSKPIIDHEPIDQAPEEAAEPLASVFD